MLGASFRRMCVWGVVWIVALGCGGSNVSTYERIEREKQEAAEKLKSGGLKLEEKQYPQGTAYSVDASGLTITSDMIRTLQNAGHVTEINLSGAKITDDQLLELTDPERFGLLIVLNLSNTGVTDEGAENLPSLPLLRDLDLTGTKVSQTIVDQINTARKAIPNPIFATVNIKR